MRPKILVVVGAVTVSLAAAATALAGNGGFAPVAPVSPNAHAIKQSYLFISIFTIAIFLLVETLLIVFVIRYRRRKRPRDADGAQVHGANRLELAWTVGPVLILFVIVAFIFVKLPAIQDVPASAAGSRNLVVDVIGTQFTWQFRYPNGVVTIDQLRAPGGTDGRAPRHRARLGRHPLLVDPGARREDGRDPGTGEQDVVQGERRSACSRASAPSSAASTTRRCSRRSM